MPDWLQKILYGAVLTDENNTNTIIANGQSYKVSGKNIVIRNGQIVVDGKVINSEKVDTVNVIVNGNVENLDCEGSVVIHGDSKNVRCGGSCQINGHVGGSISAGGSVSCGGKVEGNVTVGGSVNIRK